MDFAKILRDNPRSGSPVLKEPFVIGAVIDVGRRLNLTDIRCQTILRDAHTYLKELAEAAGLPLPQNKLLPRIREMLAKTALYYPEFSEEEKLEPLGGADWVFAAAHLSGRTTPSLARNKQKEAQMKQRQIFITAFDKERLDELIAVAREFGEQDRDDLDDLAAELDRAIMVESTKVPADVVTMNSKVVLHDLNTSEDETYALAFPHEADASSGAISVLAPIGTAILGYRQGDVVEWPVPSGIRRIRIEKILYQPEAAGDFER